MLYPDIYSIDYLNNNQLFHKQESKSMILINSGLLMIRNHEFTILVHGYLLLLPTKKKPGITFGHPDFRSTLLSHFLLWH